MCLLGTNRSFFYYGTHTLRCDYLNFIIILFVYFKCCQSLGLKIRNIKILNASIPQHTRAGQRFHFQEPANKLHRIEQHCCLSVCWKRRDQISTTSTSHQNQSPQVISNVASINCVIIPVLAKPHVYIILP